MQLGLVLGYVGNPSPADFADLAREAERLGYDSVWTSDSWGPSCWGSDAFTPLSWVAAHTSRIRLGTAVAHMAARTPTVTAMHALLLDHLCGGRLILGLGLSRPYAVQGWYGRPFPKSPLTATREYVAVVRAALRREKPVAFMGDYHSHPYTGPDAVEGSRPMQTAVQPLRADVPIYLAALGPKLAALTTQIANGWTPMHWSPFRPEVRRQALAGAPEGFRIAPLVHVRVCDDHEQGIAAVKPVLARYIGGSGERRLNFHAAQMARMGFEREAERIPQLYREGREAEAVAAMPDTFVDETSLIGPRERIADRLSAWKDSGATDLLVISHDRPTLRTLAELVL